jgi:hypothetical protein
VLTCISWLVTHVLFNRYPIRKPKESLMVVIPPLDHDSIKYPSVRKFFYAEHEEIRALQPNAVRDLRAKLGIRVRACVRVGGWVGG